MTATGKISRPLWSRARAGLFWLLLLAPALLVLGLALPRLADGLARAEAEPVPDYIEGNVRLAPLDYIRAQKALAAAPSGDGVAHLLAVVAGRLRGEPARALVSAARSGLVQAPGDARGWIEYARLLERRHPSTAASALAFSYVLAPREYFLIAPRLVTAAPLWTRLSRFQQALLFTEVRVAGKIPQLHPALIAALRQPGGGALITAAYAGRPQQLRALNRALSAQILGLAP